MEELIKARGFQFNEFAKLIKVPPTTLSGWTTKSDFPLKKIRKVCEGLNIKLWEFFIESEADISNYVPSYLRKHSEWVDVIRNFEANLTEDQQKLILRAFADITRAFFK